MQGKTVVITGATSGIGEVAAIRLSQKGARIVLVARDRARADATLKKLSGTGHTVHFADLSRISEMKRLANELAAEPEIEVLMNNAGALFNTRQVTEDGLEKTFATNHMSYFVVTNMLLPKLKPAARIVSTASDAHRGAKLNFDDLQSTRSYSGFPVYGKSKLCNIMFNCELARRIEGTGVTANCLHPGVIATNLMRTVPVVGRLAMALASPVLLKTPAQGAATQCYLATNPGVSGVTGGYFRDCNPAHPFPVANDPAAAARLWEVSEAIAAKVS